MTDIENTQTLTLYEYLHFIGLDRFTINLVKNDKELSDEIMYKLRVCRKKESSLEKIQAVIEKYTFNSKIKDGYKWNEK